MGLFDRFKKQDCEICGKEVGMFGYKKLEDGEICKDCLLGEGANAHHVLYGLTFFLFLPFLFFCLILTHNGSPPFKILLCGNKIAGCISHIVQNRGFIHADGQKSIAQSCRSRQHQVQLHQNDNGQQRSDAQNCKISQTPKPHIGGGFQILRVKISCHD